MLIQFSVFCNVWMWKIASAIWYERKKQICKAKKFAKKQTCLLQFKLVSRPVDILNLIPANCRPKWEKQKWHQKSWEPN